MKKLLIGIFALGLVIAFAAPASAVDVRVSGHYKVEGWYIDNQSLLDVPGIDQPSDAFYTQRLRVATTLAVSQRLMVNVRADIMEGVWGGSTGTADKLVWDSSGNSGVGAARDTNIQFDYVNMRFITNCGIFDVGYLSDSVYGTNFGDEQIFIPKISWTLPIPNTKFISIFQIKKFSERDWSGVYDATDGDHDRYMWIGMYNDRAIQAALLLQYDRDANNKFSAATAGPMTAFLVSPYVKATFGDLYLEAQMYWFADGKLETPAAQPDVDIEGLSLYLMGKYNLGPAYVGGLFAFVQGDMDLPTNAGGTDNAIGGRLLGGGDFNPMLILWNDDLYKWGGSLGGATTASMGQLEGSASAVINPGALLYQINGGYQVNEQLDLYGSFSYARAHKTGTLPAGYKWDKDMGYELNIKATYKIFDNLEYQAAFGYFWAGDWFKGSGTHADLAGTSVDDNYLLFHKLTLNF